MIRLLLVDDDQLILDLVMAQLALSGGSYEVMAITQETEVDPGVEELGGVDLLLCDVYMPGSGGLVVADTLESKHPELRTVFMSGAPLAMTEAELRGRIFLRKPFTLLQLTDALAASQPSSPPPPPPPARVRPAQRKSEGFSGFVNSIRLFDVVQMFLLSHQSGRLLLRGPEGRSGWMHTNQGRILDAAIEGTAFLGEEAVSVMFSWKNGSFIFLDGLANESITIHKTWQHLAMDAAMAADHAPA